MDPELGFIKDTDVSPQGGDRNDTSYDSRNGVRCIRVSPDGKHLASGDRAGNIRLGGRMDYDAHLWMLYFIFI